MNQLWPLVAVCGKFQPFHNDHLKYVLSAFEFGEHVIIGVTNPDLQRQHASHPFIAV